MTQRPAMWLFSVLAGCSFGDHEAHWSEQLQPGGACWEVNLVDGLETSDTSEIHALFQCLNRSGHLDSLAELDASLEEHDRFDRPVGWSVVEVANALPTTGYDLFGLAGKALQVLQTYHSDSELVLQSIVELIYGVAYPRIDDSFDLDSETALEQGPAVPLVELLSSTSTVVLDEGQAVPDRVVEIVNGDFTRDAVCTLAGLTHTDDAELHALGENMVPALAEAWISAENTDNDLWSGAHDNSYRNFLNSLEIGEDDGFFNVAGTPISILLNDTRVQSRTSQVLEDAARNGHIDDLPSQVLYLASVDTRGAPLSRTSSRTSALQAGARLIYNTNTDLSCSALGLSISFDNVATSILRTMARQDAEDVVDGLALLSDLLGSGFSQSIIETIADLGVCPAIDRQMLADLEVIDRLQDEEAGDLVIVVHGLLDAVYEEGNFDRLNEVVDVISAVHSEELTPPFEEALRDLASTALMDDISTWIATLNDPTRLHVDACPDDSRPFDFDLVWTSIRDLAESSDSEDPLKPVVLHLIDSDQTWVFIDRASTLAVQSDARIHALPYLVVELFTDEAVQDILDVLSSPLNDPDTWIPSLAIIETAAIREALIRPSGEVEGPLPFVARLITSDTVTVMLQTIDLILDSLGEQDEESSD